MKTGHKAKKAATPDPTSRHSQLPVATGRIRAQTHIRVRAERILLLIAMTSAPAKECIHLGNSQIDLPIEVRAGSV